MLVSAFDRLLSHALRESAYSVVGVSTVENLESTCEELINFTDSNLDLVLANSGSTSDQLITFGCPCLKDSFPTTFQPMYERRTLSAEKQMNAIFKRVLIHGADTSVNKNIMLSDLKILKVDKNKGWILIENKLKTRLLLKKMKIQQE